MVNSKWVNKYMFFNIDNRRVRKQKIRESSKGTGGEARKRAQKNLERGRATQAGEV